MTKAIIFDCFGVIYPDTLSLVERPYIKDRLAVREDIRALRRQADRGLVDREEFWDGVAQRLGITRAKLDNDLEQVQHADWELLEFIKSLRSKYKTAMLSNVGRGFIERIFDADRPQEAYFDKVIISADVGVTKPSPEPYLVAIEQLNIKPQEAIFIDDKEKNAQGARSLGMKAIVYENFDQFKVELVQILSVS